ncbi:MAG: hypothetical protein V4724_37790 [Pseudomonadota bacterium]
MDIVIPAEELLAVGSGSQSCEVHVLCQHLKRVTKLADVELGLALLIGKQANFDHHKKASVGTAASCHFRRVLLGS